MQLQLSLLILTRQHNPLTRRRFLARHAVFDARRHDIRNRLHLNPLPEHVRVLEVLFSVVYDGAGPELNAAPRLPMAYFEEVV